jgi:hypothetical protein
MYLYPLILVSIARVSRRICNLGKLHVFKNFMLLHELPSRIAASIQVHVPAWTPFKYYLVFKETQDQIIALFLYGA